MWNFTWLTWTKTEPLSNQDFLMRAGIIKNTCLVAMNFITAILLNVELQHNNIKIDNTVWKLSSYYNMINLTLKKYDRSSLTESVEL